MPLVEQSDPLLTLEQAAEYLNVNVRHMRRTVAERRIEYTRVGRLLRFRRSALDGYLAEQTRRAVVVKRVHRPEPEPVRARSRKRRTARAA